MRVGIIGCGTLGGALAAGLRRDASIAGVETTTRATRGNNVAVARASDVVLLCTKPEDVEPTVREIAPALQPHQVLISAAAGVGTGELRAWSGEATRVVRVMPNTPSRAREGMTVVARDERSCERALDSACRLFGVVGRTVVMEEAQMDAVTAISGCGPAFVFVAIEALVDGAIALGIPYPLARELVAQTVLGSAKLVRDGAEHPAALKTAVATPAGRTIRGLLELESGKLRATLMRAVLAAAG